MIVERSVLHSVSVRAFVARSSYTDANFWRLFFAWMIGCNQRR